MIGTVAVLSATNRKQHLNPASSPQNEFRQISLWLGVGAASHSLFIKTHTDRVDLAQKDKILFVGNIDYRTDAPWTDAEANLFLKDVFGGFGDISSISVSSFKDRDNDCRNSRFAHICFDKKSSVKAALQASSTMYSSISESIGNKWGLATSSCVKTPKELALSFPLFDVDMAELKEEVGEFISNFEELEQVHWRKLYSVLCNYNL